MMDRCPICNARYFKKKGKSNMLKSTRLMVMVSTNGKPIENRLTYTDIRALRRDDNGNLCVVVKGKIIYDTKYWRYL